ncbi:MAG: TonB-dependent receptor [Pseudomonadota bacterium]
MAINRFLSAVRILSLASCATTMALTPVIAAAQASEAMQIDIAEQPLSQTLTDIARRYGVSVRVSGDLTRGRAARRISGNMTVEQALRQALQGTGLVANRSPNGGFVIAPNDLSGLQRQDTIIVTGTKQNQTIQNTRESVVVVSEEQIDETVVYDLPDLLLRLPNVTSNSATLSGIGIRGIGISGVGGAGTGRTLNVYIDGAPASFEALTAGSFNLWDIQQVEVLRGPQSTTQGRNALAGAIVVQTADPDYDFGMKARAIIGNNETYQISGMVTGPIIEDQVAFRLSADYREEDFNDFIAPLNQNFGATDALSLVGKLLIEPKALDGLRVELNAQYTDTNTDGRGQRFDAPPASEPAFETFDPFDRITFDPRGGTGGAELLRLIADIQYQFSENWSISLLTSFDDTVRASEGPAGTDRRTEDTYQADFRVHFDYGRLRGWIGGYYFQEDRNTRSSTFLDLGSLIPTTPAGLVVDNQSNQTFKTENYAVYADLAFDITDKLTLNVGGRFDREEVFDTGPLGTTVFLAGGTPIDPDSNCFVAVTPCTRFIPVSDTPPIDTDFDVFLPKAGVIYAIDDLRSVSFMYQRGYRAGGGTIISFGAEELTFAGFDPEFLNNYELAFRSLWLDGRLSVNANIFYSTWRDQQVTVPIPGSLTAFEILNAGSSELYGLELSTSFEVTEELSVYGNLGLLQTEFTDFPFLQTSDNPPQALDGLLGEEFFNLAGNEFPGAPNVTASFGASYRRQGGFFGSFNISYRGSAFSDVENFAVDRNDSFVLANARIGFQRDWFRLSVFANNLFAQEFTTSRNLLAAQRIGSEAVAAPTAIRVFNLNQPRAFGVELELTF